MKIVAQDTFFKSFHKLANTQRWWRWEFYEDKYYEWKWRFWALKNYRKVVMNEMRPWDYHGVLALMKKHFEILAKRIERGWEIEESKSQKVKDINRCVELLDNIIQDNYSERCGYDHKRNNFDFVQVEGKSGQYEMVDSPGSQSAEEKSEIIKNARKLEEEEWAELWDIIKKGKSSDYGMMGWWE
jgi:hypothetical protein